MSVDDRLAREVSILQPPELEATGFSIDTGHGHKPVTADQFVQSIQRINRIAWKQRRLRIPKGRAPRRSPSRSSRRPARFKKTKDPPEPPKPAELYDYGALAPAARLCAHEARRFGRRVASA